MKRLSFVANKTIVITGCSSGIGQHLAYSLSKKFNIIGIDKSSSKSQYLDDFYQADLSDAFKAEKTFNKIPNIDIAINCAGVSGIRESIDDLTVDDVLDVYNQNTISMFNSLKQQISIMKKNKTHGKIINLSSILASIGIEKSFTYAASKAGILSLTKVAAVENRKYNILINSISPATIDTPLVRELNKNNSKDYTIIYPVGHIGALEDVGSVVKMLINNNFMTGNDIRLDGGLTQLFEI